jgi:hypothetical protein
VLRKSYSVTRITQSFDRVLIFCLPPTTPIAAGFTAILSSLLSTCPLSREQPLFLLVRRAPRSAFGAPGLHVGRVSGLCSGAPGEAQDNTSSSFSSRVGEHGTVGGDEDLTTEIKSVSCLLCVFGVILFIQHVLERITAKWAETQSIRSTRLHATLAIGRRKNGYFQKRRKRQV